MSFKYQHLAIGGTFDRFHAGHQHFIDTAFELAHNISIGIVDDQQHALSLYRGKKLGQTIESYEIREKRVKDYLKNKDYLNRATIFPLRNIYGISIVNPDLEAILVTKNTYPNALKINEERKKNLLKPIKIELTHMIKDQSGKDISSERIRSGEIDEKGCQYLMSIKDKMVLPENLRDSLRIPLGQIIKGTDESLIETAKDAKNNILKLKPSLIVSVGDIVTMTLSQVGLEPDIQIIDHKNKRKKINFESDMEINKKYHIANEPGTISKQAAIAFRDTLDNYLSTQEKQQISVTGEEDLMTLIAVLLSPLQSVIVYGQVELGVIIVYVTEEKKQKVREMISKFI